MEIVMVMQRQLSLCLLMLQRVIEATPDEIWPKVRGGYVYWQQIYHALHGAVYWLRTEHTLYTEPFSDLNLYPELDGIPEHTLSKEDLIQLLQDATRLAVDFFEDMTTQKLSESSEVFSEITNLDVICMQIRHLQYHIGHCNAILRESGYQAAEWVDYSGD